MMSKEQMVRKYKTYLSYIVQEKELAQKGADVFTDIDPVFFKKIEGRIDRINAKISVVEQVLIDLGVPTSEW